jgi:hypothetical protein
MENLHNVLAQPHASGPYQYINVNQKKNPPAGSSKTWGDDFFLNKSINLFAGSWEFWEG